MTITCMPSRTTAVPVMRAVAGHCDGAGRTGAHSRGKRHARGSRAEDRAGCPGRARKGSSTLRPSRSWCCATKQGQESRRQLRVQVLEVSDDGDKSLFVFDEPRDVQGTAFLIHAHREDADDQWLYLPALKRVKRISSANRSGSFMGSEFAYEDMTAQEVEKFTTGTCATSRAAIQHARSLSASPWTRSRAIAVSWSGATGRASHPES